MADTAETCKKCRNDITEATQCDSCDVKYCSRSCLNLHWKTHKKNCARNRNRNRAPPRGSPASASAARSPPRGLEEPIAAPFTKLDRGTYLHDRPEKDVYKVLIDTYRLRMDDNHNIDHFADEDSIYALGRSNDGSVGFCRFLGRAESMPGFLPAWWGEEKRRKCEELGAAAGWSNLRTKISKADVIQHYGDPQFPMQLRILGESVWGSAPGGADGTSMRKMLASMESGTGPAFASHLAL